MRRGLGIRRDIAKDSRHGHKIGAGREPAKVFGPIEKAHIFTYVSKTGADERSFVSLASLLWRLHKPVGFVAV